MENTSESFEHVYKVILVGDSGVGKSNLLQRYINKDFTEELDATIGAEFAEKYIVLDNGVWIKLQLWDTSGSEKYKAITKAHYRGALGAILVYDVTDLESFENLDKWIEEISEKAGDYCTYRWLRSWFRVTSRM